MEDGVDMAVNQQNVSLITLTTLTTLLSWLRQEFAENGI